MCFFVSALYFLEQPMANVMNEDILKPMDAAELRAYLAQQARNFDLSMGVSGAKGRGKIVIDRMLTIYASKMADDINIDDVTFRAETIRDEEVGVCLLFSSY